METQIDPKAAQTVKRPQIPQPGELTPEILKSLRAYQGVTQEELASSLCLSKSIVSLMESGSRPITKRTERAIIEHFRQLESIKAVRRGIIPKAEYSMEVAGGGV